MRKYSTSRSGGIFWKILKRAALQITLAMVLSGVLLAHSNRAQEVLSREVTVTLNEVTLREVLSELETATKVKFVFSTDRLKLNDVVSLEVVNRRLGDILNDLLTPRKIHYVPQPDNDYIVLMEQREKSVLPASEGGMMYAASDQSVIVSGTVTGSDGFPIPGVNIVIKGTVQGTVTDVDGKYRLDVGSRDAILVFSFVGYLSQEVAVGQQTEIDVVMMSDVTALDEVVVVALGIEKEAKAIPYNVQSISGEEVTRVSDANLVNALYGKVAGVTINASSAGIGGAARVVMRGTKSISGNNNALYVIDGIPLMSLETGQPSDLFTGMGQSGDGISNISSDDIESISVLSGPAAAALYGSQAANGVVMITTKKGAGAEGLTLDVSNNTTFFTPFVTPRFQNTYGSESQSYHSWGEKLSTPSDYDPLDFFQTGYNVTNSVSLSTSSQKSQNYFGVSSVTARGIIPNNTLGRYNFSFRNSTKFMDDRLKLDVGAMYIVSEEQNMIAQGQYFNPLIPVYLFPRGDDMRRYETYERFNPERNFKTQFWPFGDLGFQMQNPHWITNRNFFNNDKHRYMLSAGLNYEINDWMNIGGRVQVDRNDGVSERRYYASTAGLFAGPAGAYHRFNQNSQQIYADGMLNINKEFDDFSVSGSIGVSLQDVVYDDFEFGGNLQSVPNLFSFTNVNMDEARQPLQNAYHDQTQAAFATAQLGYKNMVFMDLTARNDWVVALGNTATKSIFYPSVGLSSVMTDVLDIDSRVLSYLKARVSYSEVGNAPQRFISTTTYPIVSGYPQLTSYLPASNLEPERTKSIEAGLNIILWDRKLSLDITGYQSSTFNQLFNPSLSASSGYSSFYINSGRIDNRGIELSASLNQQLASVHWTSSVVYSLNRNKIVELLPSYTNAITGETVRLDSLDMGGTTSTRMILREGGSMGDLYVNTLKKDEHGYTVVGLVTQAVSSDPNRFIKAGSVNPDYVIGWRNSFSYKGIEVNFLINARVGGVGVSVTQAVMDAFGVSEASARARDAGGVLVNGYQLPAQPYYTTVGGGTSGVGANYVYSATNVRLAEMSVGYDVPLQMDWLKNLNVSLIGRNLFMFYNKAPFDPEITASTGTYYQGIDYFMQPSLRSVGFAVKGRF